MLWDPGRASCAEHPLVMLGIAVGNAESAHLWMARGSKSGILLASAAGFPLEPSHKLQVWLHFLSWASGACLFKYTFTMLLKLCSYCLSILGWMCSWGNIRQDFSWNSSLKLLQQVLCCRNAEQLSPLCTFLCTPVLPYSAGFVQCLPPKNMVSWRKDLQFFS